MFEATILYR